MVVQSHQKKQQPQQDHAPVDSMTLYLAEIRKIPSLSRQEERLLAIKIQEGDKAALEQIVTANLKLVVDIAKQYSGRNIPIGDLIQTGNLGLMNAAESFSHKKRGAFAVHASRFIRDSILDLLIASSSNAVARMQNAKNQRYNASMNTAGRLDGNDAMEYIDRYEQVDAVRQILKSTDLEPRQKLVVTARYIGIPFINNGEPLTTKQTAEFLEVTPRTITQIETKALAKIAKYLLDKNTPQKLEVGKFIYIDNITPDPSKYSPMFNGFLRALG